VATVADHYQTLGVAPTAGSDAIHRAYRELARLAHPDRSGDPAAMVRLNAAWEVLRDPVRRAEYDRDRTLPADHAGPPPGHPFGPVLTFGRYAGWSIGEVAQVDPAHLDWLRRAPIGRGYGNAIEAVFRELAARPLTLGGRRAPAPA
jgi:curved DNA-binding protein CbpA